MISLITGPVNPIKFSLFIESVYVFFRNMLAAMNDNCIVCGESCGDGDKDFRKVGTRGRASLIDISKKRQDTIYQSIQQQPDIDIYVHNCCYKTYTAHKNVMREIKGVEFQQAGPSLRRVPYDYMTHCLICAEEIKDHSAKQHPERHSQSSSIEYVNRTKNSIIQESLIAACNRRHDTLAINVKARIEFAGDLRAVEAKYHRNCMQMFLSEKNIKHSDSTQRNIRNLNAMNDDAFKKLCSFLRESKEQLFTVTDLRTQMSQYLPEAVPAYSLKHLSRRLQEHFDSEISVTEVPGKSSVVTFKTSVSAILQESLRQEEKSNNIKSVGKNIKEVLQTMEFNTDVYPLPSDIDLCKLDEETPEMVRDLVKTMFKECRSGTAKEKKLLQQISISHVIMQSAGPQTYISPLLLSVGIFIHQTTRSRLLLDLMAALGFSVSYAQVMAFERAAVKGQSHDTLHAGIVPQDQDGGFCQWIADNFDKNEDTVTGHGTSHTMGIIGCQSGTDKVQQMQPIKRTKVSAKDILDEGHFGNAPVRLALPTVLRLSYDCVK